MNEELTTLEHRSSRFNPVDLALFLRALRLVRLAQRVKRVAVPDVVAAIANRGGGGRGHQISRVDLAAARAVRKWHQWFGGLDTCLTRSLVAGGLLTGRGDVMLNIGFRLGEDQPAIDGHAWVSVDGIPVGTDGDLSRERYTRVLTVPFLCSSGEQ